MKAEEFHNNMETPLPSTFDGYVRKSVMFEFAEQYAQQVSREKCESCVFSYHNKTTGHHEVEDFYKEKPGDDDGQTFSPAI